MSMFDWYWPRGTFECPVCHTPLREWQGKDGPRALYIWQQGVAAPVDQVCDEECKGLPEVTQASRLPSSFTIYSYDCGHHRVSADCRAIDGVWSETRLDEVLDLQTRSRVESERESETTATHSLTLSLDKKR